MTSYRAEARAVYEAVARAGEPICIVCDNAAVVAQLTKILANKGQHQSWRNDDECYDFWEAIAKRIRRSPFQHEARWMPSHLDEPEKASQLEAFLGGGGDQRWIAGNAAADTLADKGAALAAPPTYLTLRERFKVLLTRTVQRMMIHIWSAHRNYVCLDLQDGHEIDEQESAYGLEDPFEEAPWDPFEQMVPEDEIADGVFEDGPPGNWDGCDLDDPGDQCVPCETQQADEQLVSTKGTPGDSAREGVRGGMGPPSDELPSETPSLGSHLNEEVPKADEHLEKQYPQGDEADEKTSAQLLAEARKRFGKIDGHFPRGSLEVCNTRTLFTDACTSGEVHANIRLGEVTVQNGTAKPTKFSFKREWLHPIAYVIDMFRWSEEHDADATLVQRRASSISFVELSILVDLVTGGIVGPFGSSYLCKAQAVKHGISILVKKVGKHHQLDMPIRKFLGELPKVYSAAATGFGTLPGICRRPDLMAFQGLRGALGAMLCYAHASEAKLAARMPRFFWYKPTWKLDSVDEVWCRIAAERAGEAPREDVLKPDLAPRNVTLQQKNKSVQPPCNASGPKVQQPL